MPRHREDAIEALDASRSPDANPSPEADAIRGVGLALLAIKETPRDIHPRLGDVIEGADAIRMRAVR